METDGVGKNIELEVTEPIMKQAVGFQAMFLLWAFTSGKKPHVLWYCEIVSVSKKEQSEGRKFMFIKKCLL